MEWRRFVTYLWNDPRNLVLAWRRWCPTAGKVTAGLAESLAAYHRVYDMCVSLWAWWEVVAAHHGVHDYACCHLQADCLSPGSAPAPYTRYIRVWVPLPFTLPDGIHLCPMQSAWIAVFKSCDDVQHMLSHDIVENMGFMGHFPNLWEIMGHFLNIWDLWDIWEALRAS